MTFTINSSGAATQTVAGSSTLIPPSTNPTRAARAPAAAEESSTFTAFVLGQIRCAKLRAELATNQCELAITALSGGLITAEQAILVLHETGLEISS